MRILVIYIFISFSSYTNSQILTFDFAGLTGSEVSANSNSNNANISSSTITRGAGLTASNNADRFNATNWALTSIANAVSGNKYMEFTITPNSGCAFSVSSIVIQLQRSGTGPSAIALRSSLDAFAANLDAEYAIIDNTTTQTFTFTFSQSNISIATTYRIYMFAEATGGTGGPGDGAGNDIIINGSTSCAGGNTITPGAITGAPFSVDCSTPDAGSIAFTSTGTFTAGNIYTAQLSNASGSFASPISIGTLNSTSNSGNITLSIPAGTVSGTGYRIRIISSNPSVTSADNGINLSVTFNPCSISTTNVTGSPFEVSCTSSLSDNGTVDFTSIGTYGPTNSYIVQLSDATGNFSNAIQIGISTNNSSNSGTIGFTIPSNTPFGSGYRIRVISTTPLVSGTNNGSNLLIDQLSQCSPSLPSQGLIINEWSNGASGEKEYYEFVVAGRCGDLVDIRGFILDDNNATFTDPAFYDGTASGIAPGHFRFSNSAQWSTIPVGSLIVIYNANDPNPMIPADDPTDSNNDSLYVVPHTSSLFERCATMPTSAEPDSIYTPCTYSISPLTGWGALSLRNAGDAIQVRNPDGSYYYGVSYGGAEISGGPNGLKLFNGSGTGMCGWFNSGDLFDINNWSSGSIIGNETPGLPNNAVNLAWLRLMRDPNTLDCPVTVLPSTTVNFKAFFEHNKIQLHWQTQSEQNNDYFTISHSSDGMNFEPIGTVKGAGNSNELMNYQFTHERPSRGINYYKLSSTDYDGTTYNKGIASVLVDADGTYFDPFTAQLKFGEKSDYTVYSSDGKKLGEVWNQESMDFQQSGFIIVQNRRKGTIERLFIP
jgi:hypothetical protein